MLDDLLGKLEAVVQCAIDAFTDEGRAIDVVSPSKVLNRYWKAVWRYTYVKCAASPINATPGTVCHDSDFVGIAYSGQTRNSPSLCLIKSVCT